MQQMRAALPMLRQLHLEVVSCAVHVTIKQQVVLLLFIQGCT
jgi:hypothetical protein